MMQLNHPLFRSLLFCLFAALLAVLFAVRAHAADIPAYDGGSQTPGSTAPGAQTEIPPDRPSMEITALLPWVTDTVSQAYTLGPGDYQENLKKVAVKFTKNGWKDFTGVLAKNEIIDKITAKGLVVTIAPGKPVVVMEGVKDGVYRWVVSIPATISYTTTKEQHTATNEQQDELTTITVTVIHVPLKDNILGVQIGIWEQT